MGAEAIGNEGDAPQEPKETPKESPKEAPKELTAAEYKAELDRARAETDAARREAAAAKKDTEGAQAYLQSLLGTLQTAASRGPEAPKDERTIAERLAENPEAVLDEHFRTRMQPIYAGYLQNQVEQSRSLSLERIAKDPVQKDLLDKYQGEVNEFMKDIPFEVQARPGSFDRAFRFVLANHLEEVADKIAEARSKEREARERGSFVEGPSGAASKRAQPEGLSDIQKQVAKGMGLTEAEYIEWSKKDQFGA